MTSRDYPTECARLRRLRGWTQATAAREHGVSERTWRRIETGESHPAGPLRVLLELRLDAVAKLAGERKEGT